MPPPVRNFAASIAVILCAAGCAAPPPPAASVPAAPIADAEPAEDLRFAPYGAAVAAHFPPPKVRYRTPGLAPGRIAYTSNDELNRALAGLAQASAPGVAARLLEVGSSQHGVPLRALHLSRAGPGAARPTVLLVGQQHGDEPAPAEALLVVAEALARGDLAALLERIDVVVMPRANPDGADARRRVAGNGIDLNRDHLLLRTPEALALATLMERHRAAVVVNAHEYTVVGRYLDKFDAVQRFDVLLQAATTPNLPAAIADIAEQRFRRPLLGALAAEGLAAEWYYTTSNDPADRRISMGGVRPDTGRNVNGLKNAVSLLVETRGVGIGRLHLQRRVHTHVVAARSVLASAARHAGALLQAQREADAETRAAACRGDVVVNAAATPTRRLLTMLDPTTGAERAINVEWQSALELRTLKSRPRPCGYWLAADARNAVQRLRALGLLVQRFAEPAALVAERWRETARSEGERADVRGRVADGDAGIVRVEVGTDAAQPLAAAAGSHYVPLDQPLAHLAVAALEPDTQSSYFANRIVTALDHGARVMAKPTAHFEAVR